jgi:hypothetical protein
VDLLGDIIDTVKKNIETLIDANKGAGLEINVEKTKYVCLLLSRHQIARDKSCTLLMGAGPIQVSHGYRKIKTGVGKHLYCTGTDCRY